MVIVRYPNKAGLLRGVNMARMFCDKCNKEQSHGYQLQDVLNSAAVGGKYHTVFVCDDCLKQAKKQEVLSN